MGSGRNNRRDLAGTCVVPARSNSSLRLNMRSRQALPKQCPFFHPAPHSSQPSTVFGADFRILLVLFTQLHGALGASCAEPPRAQRTDPARMSQCRREHNFHSLPECQETMPLGMPASATLTDTRTARAGKAMQIPSDFWRGWVFGEIGSVWGKPEKTNQHFVNHSHHCLLPHWEAVPDSGAVNASALFLDPVSAPACIFSYINYPSV